MTTKAAPQLQKAPLIYFVAQLRFAEIVNVARYIPEIQDRLRHLGFPLFRKTVIPQISVEGGVPSFRNFELSEFQNKESFAGITLSSNSVAYHTSKYTVYKEFEPQFEGALSAIHELMDISVLQRSGLRYLNLIKPKDGETLDVYMQPGVLGLHAHDIGISNRVINYVLQGATSIGTLVIKFRAPVTSGAVIPIDLQPLTLAIEQDIGSTEAGILDLDHFSSETKDFSVQSALAGLDLLHPALDKAFNAATTEAGRRIWEE